MPYDNEIERMAVKACKGAKGLEPRKMFGGVCWLYRGNMAFGVYKENLIVRLGDDAKALEFLKAKKALPFDITGKRMKGWVMIPKPSLKTVGNYRFWLDLGLAHAKTLPAK